MTSLPLLTILLAACEAYASRMPVSDPVVRTVEATRDAVRGTSDENVVSKGHALQNALQDGWFVFRPSMTGIPRPRAHGDTAETIEIVEDAKKRLTGNKQMASAELRQNVESQAQLVSEGRMRMVSTLPDNTMGVYKFAADKVQAGFIELNDWLRQLAQVMPLEFLAAIGVHEEAHRSNPALVSAGVIEGEVVSFLLQYEWLKFVDPTGHKLAMLRLVLEEQLKAHPNPLTRKALEYAVSLDVLVGTGGDRQKIREYVMALGYREGQDRHSPGDGHDHAHEHGDKPSA